MKNYIYILAMLFFTAIACEKDDDGDNGSGGDEKVCESDQFKFHFVNGGKYYSYERHSLTDDWSRNTGTYSGGDCDSTSEYVPDNGGSPPLFRFQKEYLIYIADRFNVIHEDNDSIFIEPQDPKPGFPIQKAYSVR